MSNIMKYQPNALDVRRRVAELPQVQQALTPIEREILNAATKTPIKDITDAEAVQKLRVMFKYIAIDVGYNVNNSEEWAYTQTRLFDIIKKYYAYYSLADIKIAFELLVIGELDAYLPHDAQGNAERKHYQQFTAEYFSRVMNAYKRKRDEVELKVYRATPAEEDIPTEEQKEIAREKSNEQIKYIYLQYKYCDIYNANTIDDILIYKRLQDIGYIDEYNITAEDRRKALRDIIHDANRGIINKYTASRASRGEEDLILTRAGNIARRREIKKIFDYLIKYEIKWM